MKKTILLTAFLSLSALAFSQFKINSLQQPDTIKFDTFLGVGLSPTPLAGELNSSYWKFHGFSDGNTQFGGSYTTGDFSRGTSTGNVSQGGIYAFDNGQTGPLLGIKPTATDFNPGKMTLKVQNNTTQVIKDLTIKYDFWFLNSEDRASSFNFYYSSNDTTYYIDSAAIATSSESADTMGWHSVQKIVTLQNANIAVGGLLYLQWRSQDISGTGLRDAIGIDDIVISKVASSGFPSAQVQFIHNSADSLLSSADIYFDDSLMFNNFAFRTATPFEIIAADDSIEVSIAPGSSIDTSSAYWKGTIYLDDGKQYVAVINGLVGSGYNPSATARPLELYMHRARTSAMNFGNTDILFFNGSTDIGALDVVETSVQAVTLVDNAGYGEFSGYDEFLTANYAVKVKDSTSTNTLYSFPLDLMTRNLMDSAIFILTSGFHNRSVNHNGTALDIMYAPGQGGSLISLLTVTSLAEFDTKEGLKLYPNPVRDYLTLETTAKNAEVSIYTMDGREVFRKKLLKDSESINISTLPKGIFLLKMTSESGSASKVFVRH